MRARLLDGRPHLGLFVDDEVVQHDDIAGTERGHQHLFDVGQETRAIDRPIEHGGRVETIEAEGRNHRVGLPMTAGRVIVESRAAGTPAVASEQIGRDAAFIEKDVLPHVAQRLPFAPAASLSDDVGTALFVGVDRYLTVNWSRSNARQTDERLAELCNASRSSASVRSGWASTSVRS